MSPVSILRVTYTVFGSDRLERILRQLSKAIISAINSAQPQRKPIQDVLTDLARLENRPDHLTGMAYEWCSMICENHQILADERLPPLALKIGFRHLDSRYQWIPTMLTHTEHHRELVDIVFNTEDSEAIADLLHAWTTESHFHEPAYTLLSTCTGRLLDLYNRADFSSRLRKLVIRSIEVIGYEGFKGGIERFVEFLNYLHVDVEDIGYHSKWILMLPEIVQSPEGGRGLSTRSWELLVELTISYSLVFPYPTYSPQVMTSLLEAREWDKLECWIGVVWMAWPPQTDTTTEDLERATVSLFHQRPGAVRKLTQWMERWSEFPANVVPEAFKLVCKQPHEITPLDES